MWGILLLAFFVINGIMGIRMYIGASPRVMRGEEAFASHEERKTWGRRQGVSRICWSFFALCLFLYIYVPGQRVIWQILMICFAAAGIGIWFLPGKK